jgi:phospholipid/cholesterol/gamma-HCH transport system substrate-binding protein
MSLNQRTLEIKVGLFLLTLLLGLVFLVAYIGIKKDLFAERIQYTVVSQTGDKIEPGMPVRLSGFTIGQATEVALDRVDRVRITIRVLKRYHQWFTEDARIILEQEGIIGNSFLKLMPGEEDSPVLEPGATMTLDKIGGVNELILEMQPVVEALRAVVFNIWDLTDYLLDEEAPVRTILTNAETMSHRLLSEQGLIHYLTQDPGPPIRIDGLLADSETAADNVNTLLATTRLRVADIAPLQEELTRTIQESRQLIAEFHGIREDIAPLLANTIQISEDVAPLLANMTLISEDVKTASRDLISLRRQGEYGLRLGTELLLRLRETWPLSRQEPEGTDPSYPWP